MALPFDERPLEHQGHRIWDFPMLPSAEEEQPEPSGIRDADGRLHLLACTRCGTYATHQVVSLAKPCVPGTPGLQRQLLRLGRRQHPHSSESARLAEPVVPQGEVLRWAMTKLGLAVQPRRPPQQRASDASGRDVPASVLEVR